MRTRLLASLAMVIGFGSTCIAPASADWTTFQPPVPLALLTALPDICVAGYCTLNSEWSTSLNTYQQITTQIQQGEMEVQNLKSMRLSGVSDPSGSGVLQQILRARTNAQPGTGGYAMNYQLAQNAATDQNDLKQAMATMQNSGDGALAAQQTTFVAIEKIAGSMEESNQIHAAEVVQQQTSIKQSYSNLSELFDLNKDPRTGWAL